MGTQDATGWRRCSSCKRWMDFGQPYYECSVSTCTRKRTGLVFCSVSCWEVHVPMLRHRDAYAVEARSPSRAEHARGVQGTKREPAARRGREQTAGEAPTAKREAPRTIIRRAAAPESDTTSATAGALADDFPVDVLIVASKLKQYVKARSGMNTSDSVMKVLSEHVRALCDDAIRRAEQSERKTVMDRDFPKPR